jgi:hypothetical protein
MERVKGMKLLLAGRINASFLQFDLFFTPIFSPSPGVLFHEGYRRRFRTANKKPASLEAGSCGDWLSATQRK